MNDTLTITHRFIVNPLARRYNGADQVTRTTEQRVADRTEFLKQLPLFVNLPEAELAGLAQDFTARRFQQGETIFFQGDPGQALYLIETGRVRIYVQDDSGQESSVIYYSAGDIFGELAAIDGLPRSASAIAADEIDRARAAPRTAARAPAGLAAVGLQLHAGAGGAGALLDPAGGQPDAARCAQPAGAQTAGVGAGLRARGSQRGAHRYAADAKRPGLASSARRARAPTKRWATSNAAASSAWSKITSPSSIRKHCEQSDRRTNLPAASGRFLFSK